MVRLPGFQGAGSACRYQALIGPNQATGLAGGFDFLYGISRVKRNDEHHVPEVGENCPLLLYKKLRKTNGPGSKGNNKWNHASDVGVGTAHKRQI